jgi:hypothetical protein
VVEGGATLVLRHSGAFELYREDGKEGDAGRIPSSNAGSPSVLPSGEVVARGAVTLPEGALLAESVVTVDPAAGVTSVEWRDDAHRLLAGLRVLRAAGGIIWGGFNGGDTPTLHSEGGVTEGFTLELRLPTEVARETAPRGQQRNRRAGRARHSALSSGVAEICLDMEQSGMWFGGAHLIKQAWPLNDACLEVGPYYPFDNGPNGVNTLCGNQWVTSNGLLVMVDADTPFLHVGMNAIERGFLGLRSLRRAWGVGIQNAVREELPRTDSWANRGDGLLRLQARDSFECRRVRHPLSDWMPQRLPRLVEQVAEDVLEKLPGEVATFVEDRLFVDSRLAAAEQAAELAPALCEAETDVLCRVVVAAKADVRAATQAGLATLPRPKRPPSTDMLARPIWTTWARYKQSVNQKDVANYARQICERGLSHSVMEIDDKWQRGYGDLEFDLEKFPDPKAMVEQLHAEGFLVTLWVMPFAAESSEAYQEGAPRGYFCGGAKTAGLKEGFFRWWNSPVVAALDLTNDEAVDWFVGRLKALQRKYGIDGFKFDAGEPCFLPKQVRTQRPMATPVEYTRLWVTKVASQFEVAEVRTGHRCTDMPIFTRMGDRFSTWGVGNGLRSIIPTLLTSGVLGYPFCLPDIVGGNAYFGSFPDKELLVRWAQANALMPAVQFSIAPWDYSADTTAMTRDVLEVRAQLADRLCELAQDACRKLVPIARPMWWLAPRDPETWRIADQFAIGDDVVVAPVVVKGARVRDIYLPAGDWLPASDPETIIAGGQWLRAHPSPLSELPVFLRSHSTVAAAVVRSPVRR